jgi:TetR/AcrR family transcriptional regulator, cholesterol catabolism regulator
LVHWLEMLDARMTLQPANGQSAGDRVLEVLDRALRAMARQPKLVAAVYMSLSSSDEGAVDCQRQIIVIMEDIIRRAIGEPRPAELAERSRIIGHVWYSALAGWVNGWSTVNRVHDELATAVDLLL